MAHNSSLTPYVHAHFGSIVPTEIMSESNFEWGSHLQSRAVISNLFVAHHFYLSVFDQSSSLISWERVIIIMMGF